MIGFICIFLLLNFLTIKLNQKIIRDYTKARLNLKIKKQTWGSSADPDFLYLFLALLLMINLLFISIIVSAGNIIIGGYAFVLLVTYFVIGLIQLFFKFDDMITNCEKISLNKSEFKLNVFWQVIINLILTVGSFEATIIDKIEMKINLPNPIPSITSRISKGYRSFDE